MALKTPENTSCEIQNFPLRLVFAAMIMMVLNACSRPPFGASMNQPEEVVAQSSSPETDCRYLPYLYQAIAEIRKQLDSVSSSDDCDEAVRAFATRLELLNNMDNQIYKGSITCDGMGESIFNTAAHFVDTRECTQKPSKPGNKLVNDRERKVKCAHRFCIT